MRILLDASTLLIQADTDLTQVIGIDIADIDSLAIVNIDSGSDSFVSAQIVGGYKEKYYNTDGTYVETYMNPQLQITCQPNTGEATREAEVRITFEGFTLEYNEDEPEKQYWLESVGLTGCELNITQSFPEPQVDDVNTDAITSGGFLFELVGSIAFPQLSQLIESITTAGAQEIADLTNDLNDIIESLLDPDLSQKARARLEEKKVELEAKLHEKTQELQELAQQVQQQVKQQVQDIVSGSSNMGKDILNHIKNIGEQSAILVAGIPKLVVNAGTCIIEPMTAVATCAVGPVATVTNPGQIMGTITRLGQQAKALKGPISSIMQSAEFLRLNGEIGKKYGLDTLLAPIEVVEKLIDVIPG